VNPFPGRKIGDKLTKQEIISAIRLSICAEEEAVHLYDIIAEYASDKRVKKIMHDVAAEEQVHIGEFQALLELFESDEDEKLKEGEKEAAKKIKEEIERIATIIPEDIRSGI
jgi:rubrerythrin